MKSSENIDAIAKALSQAQAEYPVVPKSNEAIVPTKTGGEYRYRYADLAGAVEAVRPVNVKYGLAVIQMAGWEDEHHVLSTRVVHESGQWFEDTMRLILPQETPQVHGSALTYARRYAYCAALGIVTDTDDDGALAEMAYGANASRKRKPPRSSTPTSGRRPVQAQDPKTDDGLAAMSARDRNKVISHFAHLDPPVLEHAEIVRWANSVLPEPVEALAKLSEPQGALLLPKLPQKWPETADASGETPEETAKRVAEEIALMEQQSELPF